MRKQKTTVPAPRLPAHLERAVAVASQTDPRTVARVVAGLPARAATRDRVRRAIGMNRDAREALAGGAK